MSWTSQKGLSSNASVMSSTLWEQLPGPQKQQDSCWQWLRAGVKSGAQVAELVLLEQFTQILCLGENMALSQNYD